MKLPRKLAILGLGVLTTLLAVGLWLSGGGSQLERWCLDWSFRHAPPKTIRDDLVHVDIDDLSIEQLGRWPWPRERIAGLINTLKAAGAEGIALDVLFPDPQKTRYESVAQSVYGAFGQVLNDAPPQPVIDDAELSQRIKEAGNVTLAMHMEFAETSPPLLERDIEGYLKQHPKTSYEDCLLQIGESDPNSSLSDEEKAEFEVAYFRVLRRVFESEIEPILRQHPQTSFRQCSIQAANLDPESSFSGKVDDTIHDAYLSVRGRMVLEKHSRGSLAAAQGQVIPPLLTLAEHARDTGLVNVKPDSDGMLRRMPLLGNDGKKTYTQFALSLALQTLQKQYHEPMTLRNSGTYLQILAGAKVLRHIDIDHGGMLINWSLGAGKSKGQKHRRIPASAVANVSMESQRLKALDKTKYALQTKWISLGKQIADPNTEELYWSFVEETGKLDKLYTQRIGLQRQDYFNRLYDPAQAPLDAEIQPVTDQEQQCETLLFQLADKLFSSLSRDRDSFLAKPSATPENGDPNEIAAFRQRAQKADKIQAALAEIPQDRAELEENIAKLQDELAGIVKGKICLIGSTATAAADFVPTPLAERTPGITVHASIYDTIVSGELIRRAGLPLNLTVIVVAGLIVTLLSLRINAAVCGPIVIALALAYALLNARVILPRQNLHLALAFPMLTLLGVFVVLTVFKEITEERAKRKIRGMFSKALSPSLVDELMRNPQLADLGGQQRDLSCMFSDLAGFTPLSQGLGAKETVKLLNTYFDCVTDVIQTRFGGYINKFLGDGIFALFGAPVTQENHTEMAVRAAVEYIDAVGQLNQDIGAGTLSVRIGITSGPVMVGNCGSTTRMDYTAIGDYVNLSARLESASKYFKTHILIEREAWRRTHLEDTMLHRLLGLARITGVGQPVWLIHVAGYRDRDEALVEPYAQYTRGIECLYNHAYAEAAEILKGVQQHLDGDFSTSVFLEIAQQGQTRAQQSTPISSGQYAGGVVTIVLPWETQAST